MVQAVVPEVRLLSVEEARVILAQHGLRPRVVEVDLTEVAGQVLARAVRADRDIPPFDRAAVDGYAIRLAAPWQEGNVFRVLGTVAAGQLWRGALAPGCAVRIMTGAPVPAGTDGVVMVERAELLPEGRVRLAGAFVNGRGFPRPGIAPRAEDARKGDPVLHPGTFLEPSHVGILAAVGGRRVRVFRKPEVAILTTGAEVVEPEAKPGRAQIRNSNGPFLSSLLRGSSVAAVGRIRSVGDQQAALRRAIQRASGADVLVLTGGVSAGDFDYVPQVLQEIGYQLHLHRIAQKPGKPLLFGTIGSGLSQRAVFGLPGNPLSVLVTAWEYLLPYLRQAAGRVRSSPPVLRATLEEGVERKPGLTYFVLGRLRCDSDGRLRVRAVGSHGSGDYISAGAADCLIPLPAESPSVEAGQPWCVHPLFRESWEVAESPEADPAGGSR